MMLIWHGFKKNYLSLFSSIFIIIISYFILVIRQKFSFGKDDAKFKFYLVQPFQLKKI